MSMLDWMGSYNVNIILIYQVSVQNSKKNFLYIKLERLLLGPLLKKLPDLCALIITVNLYSVFFAK